MKTIAAIIKPGYRVASGQAVDGADQRFNEDGGTIRLQIVEFRKLGLDLDRFFGGKADETYVVGTLGCDISPKTMTVLNPEYQFKNVRWTHKFDSEIPNFTENFFLSQAIIIFKHCSYKSLVYIPDPATKPGHFHPLTTIEVISEKIYGIKYGDKIDLVYNPTAIKITD